MSVRTPAGLALALALCGVPVPADEPAPAKKLGCPYPVDHAKALDPKDEVVARTDAYTQYRVEFTGIKDDRVPAYLYVPTAKGDAKGRYPAVLLQYGSGGNKKTDYIVAIGKEFVAKGFVVLTIDSPGRGERRKAGEKEPALGLVGEERIRHYCGDYSRSVDYLASRADVDPDRLGFVGISWGAITGITYCAHDPRIKAVGSVVGGGDFLGLYTPEQAEKVAREGSTSTDPVCHVARIAPRPLLFINVTKDQLILRPWAEALHKAAGDGAKVVWLETDHYFKGIDKADLAGSISTFLTEKMPAKR